MISVAAPHDNMTLESMIEIHIDASRAVTFAALIEELSTSNTGHADAPMPMVLEARPGGRWFRDLGSDNGHCWGHVQAIRSPDLLEVSGPLMMSFAVSSNVQWRLTDDDGGTRITFRHSAFGLFPDGYRENLGTGFAAMVERAKQRAERQTAQDTPSNGGSK